MGTRIYSELKLGDGHAGWEEGRGRLIRQLAIPEPTASRAGRGRQCVIRSVGIVAARQRSRARHLSRRATADLRPV